MRKVINISLSTELYKEVEKAVKSGRYSSKSEFFRDLIRLWQDEKLLNDVRESEKEFAEGRGRVLRSLKDLR